MKQTVVILATGGTIAGIGEEGKTAGYQPGTLTADDLIRTIPEIMELAEIETIQICNINSGRVQGSDRQSGRSGRGEFQSG